jgi:hypothetical protein
MRAFRLLMAIAVLGCIAASATFAFEFGWMRGATDVHRWTYALAGVALDLLKAGLPIFGALAWHESKPARAFACWIVFLVLTGLSLWCAYGTTATQLAVKFANQAVASTAQTSRQATLDRLLGQRKAMPVFVETSEAAVVAAQEAVDAVKKQAEDERQRGGCAKECKNREKDERIARTALAATQTNRATTIRAADLDAKIADAEEALNRVDIKAVTMVADPQSASIANVIGADQNLIAALSHAVFAISIELGSGVGFWLVFGHGAPNRRREDAEPIASTELIPIDRRAAVDLQIIDDKPAEIVERFFLEVMRPRRNGRVQSMAVWTAYQAWCEQRGYSAVSHAMFGRLARWRKDRVGGTVWYLDAELAEGYVGLAPVSGPKALPEPATIAKGTPTAH